jgi:hypothetical protein
MFTYGDVVMAEAVVVLEDDVVIVVPVDSKATLVSKNPPDLLNVVVWVYNPD